MTRQPLIEFLEFAIVVPLATHMTLGLRVPAIEFFDFHEKTLAALSVCFAAVLAVGLIFVLNLGESDAGRPAARNRRHLWLGALVGGIAAGGAGFAFGLTASSIWLHRIDPLHSAFLITGAARCCT